MLLKIFFLTIFICKNNIIIYMDNQKNHFKSFSTYSQYEEYKAKVLNVPYVIYIEDNKEYIYSYSEEPLIDYELKHFTIQALESGDFVIAEPRSRFNYFKYSLNDGEWVDFTNIETTLTLSENDTISISCDCDYFLREIISTSCKFNVYGNIMSLIFGDNFVGKTSLCGFPQSFVRLFNGCTTLVSAKNLILPATTLAQNCYQFMFEDCASLVNAPELPATTLENSCYCYMFYGCTSLVNAPKLPATTLANRCYQVMFNGCTSLIEAPELPATTLAGACYDGMFVGCTSLVNAPKLPVTTLSNYCYTSMFYGCTSLVNAPELPATTLAKSCYSNMFNGCTNLNKVTMLATDISATDCLSNWLSGVSETGTFIKESGVLIPSGPSGIPEGWNVVVFGGDTSGGTTESGSTNLDLTGYFSIKNTGNDVLTITSPTSISHMKLTETEWTESDVTLNPNESVYFKGVIEQSKEVGTFTMTGDTTCDIEGNVMSLVYGDEFEGKTDLSGTVSKFRELFIDCVQLINANNLILPAITLGTNCYGRMFNGCTSLVNVPELPATTLADDCYSTMFYGCTSLVNAPELPAKTLGMYCYDGMFGGCTSLVTAPALPATTLDEGCYSSMFNGCTSLVEAPELPATTLAGACYDGMFDGCSNLNKVTMLATDISAEYCLDRWVNGVGSSGTFIKHPNMTTLPTGSSGIPNGWVVQDYIE